MTVVENLTPRVQYNYVTEQQQYPITFPYIERQYVKCMLDNELLTYNIDYQIPAFDQESLDENELYLTLLITPESGSLITIYRETTLDQQAEFPQEAKFSSQKITEALDKLTHQQQEQQDDLDTCLRLSKNIPVGFNTELPEPAANQVIQWNEDGTQLINYDLREEIETIDAKADEAIDTAEEADTTANQALSIANSASTTANSAVNTANDADTKSDAAVATANQAASDASDAVSIATSASQTASTASQVATAASEKVDDLEEDIEAVIEAAEKINELEEAVDTAVTAATNASTAATNASTAATNASTAATNASTAADTATQKAQEVSQALNNISTINNASLLNGGNINLQVPLVSGTNIKTINNNSILGSGDLTLDGLPSQTGNAGKFLTTDGTDASWEGVPSRNIGEIFASTIPVVDAGAHLLDGSLLDGSGIYSDFVNHIADLYEANPNANYFYHDKQLRPWTQPVLSANGTMGGDSYACAASSNESGMEAYKAFDNNLSTRWGSNEAGLPDWLTFYSPVPLRLSNVYLHFYASNELYSSGEIQGSNDNSTWTTLATFSANSALEINLSISTNISYKYIRFYGTAISSGWGKVAKFKITAQQETVYTAEEQWQTDVSTYGACGKFVYTEGTQSYYAWNTALGSICYTLTEEKVAPYYYKEDGAFVETNLLITLTTRASQYDEIGIPSTVRLPKITGFVEGTTDATALGNLVEAGLPNIKGGVSPNKRTNTNGGSAETNFIPANQGNGQKNGAFDLVGGATDTDYNNLPTGAITFDASRSNPIYGNSSTVQPQAIKVLYYIVIATTTKTDIQVDIDEIATDLNGKADVDLSNTNNQGKILMSGMGMPSNKYITLTLGASGTQYTAPANGWFYFKGKTNDANQYLAINNTTTKIETAFNLPATGQTGKTFVPAKKGDIIKLDYNTGSDKTFIFIYAEGSESEAN